MSEQEQHTPEPWTLEESSITTIWEGTKVQVALMSTTTWSHPDGGKNKRWREETKANAHRIVAVPAMLEALEEFMSTTSSHLEAFGARRLAGPILAQARPPQTGQEQADG